MKGEGSSGDKPEMSPHIAGTDDWTVPADVKSNPLFVEIGQGGNVIDALKKLNKKMLECNLSKLIFGGVSNAYFGRKVEAGRIGIWENSGKPMVSLHPGKYAILDPATRWSGSYDITETLEIHGLTIAQVGQSEAMVVQDPQNRVFVIRNGGFVSFGANGRFKILAVVDTLNLGENNAIREGSGSSRILGYKHDVKSTFGSAQVTVATFFNVPANNVVILQQGSKVFGLGGGQHVITNPSTTYRAFYSLGERQHSFRTQPAYTLEGVPVVLDLNLRFQIFDPVTLTQHYDDPLQAMVNPAQTAVNGVVSRLSYQQFMRASKVGGDVPEVNHVPWLESFKQECVAQLGDISHGHGIKVLSFEVMDRRLEGTLGKDLERQAETVLQNQLEATQIELRNHINTEKQKGILEVAKVEQQAKKTVAETEYFITTKNADAKYYESMKQAEAKAASSALSTEQEAKNIISLAEARKKEVELQGNSYASVPTGHAQRVQLLQIEVEKRKAMPQNTVWFESEIPSTISDGFGVAKGVALANMK